MDIEKLYFPETDSSYSYAIQRDRNDVENLLSKEIGTHENFVFASVKGDYREEIKENADFIISQIKY